MARRRRKRTSGGWLSDKKQLEKLIAYVFGLIFIIALLILAIAFPEPTQFQYVVFRIVLALAAAGVASMIPGFIEVQISNVVRAGGALAVFVLVYFYNPAALVSDDPWISELHNLRGDLGNLEGMWERLDESDLPCERIHAQAAPLGERFNLISDKHLGGDLGAMIEKYRYAQYAYLIASDVHCERDVAQEYAQKSLRNGENALALIEKAKEIPGVDGQSLRTWLDSDFTADRIYFHTALAQILSQRWGDLENPQAVLDILDNVRDQYYIESGVSLEGNYLLASLMNDGLLSVNELKLAHPCDRICHININ